VVSFRSTLWLTFVGVFAKPGEFVLCTDGLNGTSCQYSNAITCNGGGEVTNTGECACFVADSGPTCLTNEAVFHLDLPGIASLGLYDHQFYHTGNQTDLLVQAIEYFTETLLLADESAVAHIGNVRIEVKMTYFNPYGATQLDAIAPELWPYSHSYATSWRLFNHTFGPRSTSTGWPNHRPKNTYADAAYAKVRLVGATVDLLASGNTNIARFVADVRQLVTQAMLGSDPTPVSCQTAKRSVQLGGDTLLEPWCTFNTTPRKRQFQSVSITATFQLCHNEF
jgi:hypothetical protein